MNMNYDVLVKEVRKLKLRVVGLRLRVRPSKYHYPLHTVIIITDLRRRTQKKKKCQSFYVIAGAVLTSALFVTPSVSVSLSAVALFRGDNLDIVFNPTDPDPRRERGGRKTYVQLLVSCWRILPLCWGLPYAGHWVTDVCVSFVI